MRTPFQRDRDRIVHSKPFRRLKGKTQVFIDPEGDHYRTRMTHALETTAISRVVARALRLNEDLVEAIGLGHDMGHTPFGHAGEQALDEALRERFGSGFRHNEQSHRIARRLNLTHEVCDGILTHTGPQKPATQEGKIVRIVDRIAYVNHDIDDARALRAAHGGRPPGRRDRAPRARPARSRIDTLVHDLVESSEAAGDIVQGEEVGDAMLSLRSFMFERVYLGPQVEPAAPRGPAGGARDLRRARRRSPSCCRQGTDDARGQDHRLPRRDDRSLRARVRRAPLGGVGSPRWRGSRRAASPRSRRRPTSSRSSPPAHRCDAPRAHASPAAARSTRSGRRASPSTRSRSSTTASAAGRAATSCASSRRPRTSTSRTRSSGSPTASA